jgi:signal transduction histidine kinase
MEIYGMRRPSAWVTALAIAGAVTAALAGTGASMWVAVSDGASLATPVMSAIAVGMFTVVGAVVVSARPRNVVGWLILGGGVMWAVGDAGADLAYRGVVVAPHSIPAVAAWGVAGSVIRGTGWYLVVLVMPVVFPDGRIPATRRHWLPATVAAAIAFNVLGVVLATDANLNLPALRNPLAPSGAGQNLSGLLSLLALALGAAAAIGAIVALRRRWRAGGPLVRQQLLLFAVAVAPPIVVGPLSLIAGADGWLFGAAALPMPVALGFAVMARGLYDLRTAANRGLVWLILSALVVGVYALVIAGVGSLVHDSRATWLPWLAAGVVALSFAPLRDTLQRGVNRLTFGRWDEPYQVLAELGQRVAATADGDRLLADVVSELEEGLGLASVTITDGQGRLLAGAGGQQDGQVAITLTAYGRPVGQLSYREPGSPLRARDGRLLDDLTGHLGGLVHERQLTDDLRRARERLVLGREEERRRLRRDLHDGLGAALAGHVLRLEAVSGRAASGTQVAGDLEALRADMADTVAGVRRLVDGLRPAALDQLGLGGAVRQAVRRLTAGTGLTQDVTICELPALPAALEVAAFRIVTEAVTNVVRHASASSVHVAIETAGRMLRVTVRDDGVGVDPGDVGSGHGLDSMRERAEELNGSLRWDTSSGTAVIADLPLAPAAAAEPPSGGPSGEPPSGDPATAGLAPARLGTSALTAD